MDLGAVVALEAVGEEAVDAEVGEGEDVVAAAAVNLKEFVLFI